MLARQFVNAGHSLIVLVGGGTGMIGDPKPDVERPLLDSSTVEANVRALSEQVKRVVGTDEVQIVNNADWLGGLGLIPFLRDVGKHFTVNNLIKRDAIAARLKSEAGITYTEFAYPLLQAYDFLHLHKEFGCTVQIGGSDQWGNITAGVELIRRKEGQMVYGLTVPLVVDSTTGKKFGKSEGNAVWLDAQKTSPFQFYQFWYNTADENLENFLKLFTQLSIDEITLLIQEHEADKGKRIAQTRLAYEVTALVHSKPDADAAQRVSEIMFGDTDFKDLTPVERDMLSESAPCTRVALNTPLADVLVESGLAASKREAREFIEKGSVSVNGTKITVQSHTLTPDDFMGGLALVKRGKRNATLLELV